MDMQNERATYEAPTIIELGDLAEITRGRTSLVLDTDVITAGSR